jgi:hypothetical protein
MEVHLFSPPRLLGVDRENLTFIIIIIIIVIIIVLLNSLCCLDLAFVPFVAYTRACYICVLVLVF